MKAERPHNVYLSQQALDILIVFESCLAQVPTFILVAMRRRRESVQLR